MTAAKAAAATMRTTNSFARIEQTVAVRPDGAPRLGDGNYDARPRDDH
jgi:hypothetical protein